MSLDGHYDDQNVFAKIIQGELPCVKVYEDDDVLSFLDIFPQAQGHTLVIPKGVSARNFLDFPEDRIGTYMSRVQMIAKGVTRALSPDGVVITQFNGAAAGQTVFHLHFHILPKFDNLPFQRHGQGQPADQDVLQSLAEKIRASL